MSNEFLDGIPECFVSEDEQLLQNGEPTTPILNKNDILENQYKEYSEGIFTRGSDNSTLIVNNTDIIKCKLDKLMLKFTSLEQKLDTYIANLAQFNIYPKQ